MLELLLEILFEMLGQLIIELGFHSLIEPFRSDRPVNRILGFLGYILLGALAGWLSLLLVPVNFIRDSNMQILNLIVSPILIGLFFAWYGRLRARKGLDLIELDRFAYGFVFAFVVALIRFKFSA